MKQTAYIVPILFLTSISSLIENFAYAQDSAAAANQIKGSIQQTLENITPEALQEQQALNSSAISGINASKLEEAKRDLPGDMMLNNVGNVIKGNMAYTKTVDGFTVVSLIRGLTNPQTQQQNLKLIQKYAEAKQPEAISFIGYMYERGLFIPKNMRLAEQYYRSVAPQYAPAMYNLAVGEFYGRFGRPANSRQAYAYLRKAHKLTQDSDRICGWLSFISWRLGNKEESKKISYGCLSPLSSIGAAYNHIEEQDRAVSLMSGMFSTGADDGFQALADFTAANYPSMKFTYEFINKYRWRVLELPHDRLAKEVARMSGYSGKPDQNHTRIATNIREIVSKFKVQKDTNKMVFSEPVPFLPFSQVDSDGFSKISGEIR